MDGWLRATEHYCDFVKLEDAQRVKFAGTLLRERAEGWLRRWEIMKEVPESWTEFKEALVKEFRPTHALKIARDSLATLQQTGTVEEYVDTFQNLALEIPDMSAAEALDRFERGLRPEAFEHVRDMEPQNLATAFRIALDFESRRKATQAIVGQQPTPVIQFPTTGQSMGITWTWMV